MASRNQLKANFSAGQSPVESDFASLIDSMAHLDDVGTGVLASGVDITALNASIATLQTQANATDVTLNQYIGGHPTTSEMQAGDTAVSNALNASLTALASSVATEDSALDAKIVTLQSDFTTLDTSIATWVNTIDSVVSAFPSTYATTSDLNTRESNLEAMINSKADAGHSHVIADVTDLDLLASVEYVDQKTSDIAGKADVLHSHVIADITDLNLLASVEYVDQTILANKVELDEEYILQDRYYDKEEVDEYFRVARWRTDQVSLFNPSVVSICTPIVSIAKQGLEVSISNVRASLYATELSVLNELAQTRAQIEVSIGNTNNTVEANRLASEQARIVLQGNIDQVSINASASIASSQSYVLGELSSVRAEVIGYTNVNSSAIVQAESDANSYTDTKVSDLLNGAGAAYDTLKELQEHITQNDSDAAVALTNQVGLLQAQLDANDTELTNARAWMGLTLVETQATPAVTEPFKVRLDAIDTSITNLGNVDNAQDVTVANLTATVTALQASITSLQNTHTALEARLTTLENTAYAAAGYVFP
jgi:hypothetical protein